MSNPNLPPVSEQPDTPILEGGGSTSRVENHPIEVRGNEEQNRLGNTAPRTGFTALIYRAVESIKQFFTHRVETPASVITAKKPSPEAEGAGYETLVVTVGETPLRLYAKNLKTLEKIQGILIQPNLMSGEKIANKLDIVSKQLTALGFGDIAASKISSGLCTGGRDMPGYVEGNETKRQENLTSSEKDEVGSFQSCQPPDKVRIAGAKALVELNSWFQTLTTCAAKYTANDKQVTGRKQVMEELLKICNKKELRVTTLEICVGGNNAYLIGGRAYIPLLFGPATALEGFLINSDGELSADRLKELKNNYGHEFVERLVQTAYQTFSGGGKRPALKAAYEEYCEQAEKTPTDLDKLLFNDDLRKICDIRMNTIKSIKEMDLSPQEKDVLIKQFEEQVEQNFQTWLAANKQVEEDGSITIDLGHIKIMVNEEQLKYVTLESLGAL
ncbi:MAG: hypothetical protein LBC11_02325 [Puniceicoccales bacterium]|jgi:hypothetical protein|nr:hypothetical protein [Puniceicoccales bacterium]